MEAVWPCSLGTSFCNLEVLHVGSSYPTCHWMDLFSVMLGSSPKLPFVNSQQHAFSQSGCSTMLHFFQIFVSIFVDFDPENCHY